MGELYMQIDLLFFFSTFLTRDTVVLDKKVCLLFPEKKLWIICKVNDLRRQQWCTQDLSKSSEYIFEVSLFYTV